MKTLKSFATHALAIASVCQPVCAQIIEEIVVTASPLTKNTETVNRPVNLLSGEELHAAASATLGETLSGQLGVSSASFGPGVGLPIIRGQSDNRVKVMRDSIGSMDASAASPDHAVTLEPLLATKIEVLRGPAALRYGSGAIGGVVNVLDDRIPNALPDSITGGAELRSNSANDEINGVAIANAALGDFAFHIDGVKRESENLTIPGFAQKNPEDPTSTTNGFIANTDARLSTGSLGAAYIDEDGFIGICINKMDNNYGVPPDSDELIRIDMHQNRYDVKAERAKPFNGIEKITTHIGFADYDHTEMENGEAGTRFENEALEARVEAVHSTLRNWNGALGVQVAQSTFAAIGEEAFIPKSDINSAGIFIIEETELNLWHYEFGLRGDYQTIKPEAGEAIDHTSVNLSGATSKHLTPNHQLILGVALSQRAPSIEESLAQGPHPATGRYLMGDNKMQEETSTNIEIGHHWHKGAIETSINIFYNAIGDYIYARDTGVLIEELVAAQYTQADATFKGAECELKAQLNPNWRLRVFADYVRATLDNGGDLPRMAPLRFGSSLGFEQHSLSSSLTVTQVAEQNHPGENESTTDAYTRLDAQVSYNLSQNPAEYLIFIKGTNLLNEEIRNPSSYLRDLAPEARRGVQAGVRLTF